MYYTVCSLLFLFVATVAQRTEISLDPLRRPFEANKEDKLLCIVKIHNTSDSYETWIMLGETRINPSQNDVKWNGTSLTLTFSADHIFKKEDNGKFVQCVIKAASTGHPTSAGPQLDVVYPPSGMPLVTSQIAGDTVTLKCSQDKTEYHGNPRGKPDWYQNDVGVTSATVKHNTITFSKSSATSGNYTCVLRNHYGASMTSLPLLVSGPASGGVRVNVIGGAYLGVLLLLLAVVAAVTEA